MATGAPLCVYFCAFREIWCPGWTSLPKHRRCAQSKPDDQGCRNSTCGRVLAKACWVGVSRGLQQPSVSSLFPYFLSISLFPCDENRSQRNRVASDYVTAPSPGPFRFAVHIIPSLTRKIPGNFCSQGLFALGMYWRALASTAVTRGTRAASPTECTRDAPGQVRSCTHRNMLCFCAAAAMSSAWLCPLQALSANPV